MTRTLLVLDLDGTIIDSRRDLATAVNLVREHYGLKPLSLDAVSANVGDGVRALVRRSLEGSAVDLDEAVALQRRFYGEHLADQTVLYPGVLSGLRTFRDGGYLLAVASNKPVVFCEAILRHFGIRGLFCRVAGDGNTARLKPDPAMVLETMAEAGTAASDTWVIGDGHTDVESARRAGVRSVFLTCGIGSLGNETPTVTCSSFMELHAVFRPGPEVVTPCGS